VTPTLDPYDSTAMSHSAFERFRWEGDRLFVGDTVYEFDERTDPGYLREDRDHLIIYKSKAQLDQFAQFFASLDFRPENIFELGIWEGGSTALWNEIFRPGKHVAVDISQRGDSEPFSRWRSARGLDEQVKTYWGVDQIDAERLRSIISEEFEEQLDLVVDDASHLYEPTKASFEALFPFLRPRGLYVIEDWQWEHNPDFADPSHPWAGREPLSRLVRELVEATGTLHIGAVRSLTVFSGFAAAQRGRIPTQRPEDFSLDACIIRRPQHDS
jgi:cephalosporin hydroxylase